jgi:DNA repair protein RadC
MNKIPQYRLELVKERMIPYQKINTQADAAAIFHNIVGMSPTEKFAVIYLNSRGTVMGCEVVATGDIDIVATLPSNLFRGAIIKGCNRIILGHNHPSGDPMASYQDLTMTETIDRASKLLGIFIEEHIVVAPDGQFFEILSPKNANKITEIIKNNCVKLTTTNHMVNLLQSLKY